MRNAILEPSQKMLWLPFSDMSGQKGGVWKEYLQMQPATQIRSNLDICLTINHFYKELLFTKEISPNQQIVPLVQRQFEPGLFPPKFEFLTCISSTFLLFPNYLSLPPYKTTLIFPSSVRVWLGLVDPKQCFNFIFFSPHPFLL
jgi:hypothetical protein